MSEQTQLPKKRFQESDGKQKPAVTHQRNLVNKNEKVNLAEREKSMKAFKLFTICFVVCSLFAANVFGACFVGINPNISGLLNAPDGPEAAVGKLGDTIYYFVNVVLPVTNCPHIDISGTITLPDGTVVNLPAIPDLLPGEVYDFLGVPVATYVIDAADLGNQPGADADEVRAVVSLEGTAVREGGVLQDASGTSNYDTTIVTPCVEVTKTPDCDETIIDDNVYYIIRITNCGDTDLEFVSITDAMFPGLSVDASCLTLAPGAFCEFTTPDYLISEADPDPLENTVTVVYNGLVGTTVIGQVTDDDTAEIDIVHPDFTVTKTCETPIVLLGEDADFEIIITNTGDVALDFATDDPAIGPFTLDPGQNLTQTVNKTAEACPTVENTISVTGSYAGGTDECQTWEDTKSPEAGPAVCDVVDPEFTVEKVCLENPVTGDTASFEITITNTTTCGVIDLDFNINDAAAGIVDSLVGPIAPGANYTATVEVPAECLEGGVSNTVLVEAFYNGQSVGTDEATAVCPCGEPNFIVEKTCVSDPVIDANAVFEINICNTGEIDLMFEIDDAAAGIVDWLVGPIAAGECDTFTVYVPAECVNGEVSNTAIVQALNGDQPVLDPKEATAVCPCAGQEGCTPGYWKNSPGCWCSAYSTDQLLNTVFDFPATLPPSVANIGNDTLMEALWYKGGTTKKEALRKCLFHAVAAILNACNEDVEYPEDIASIVDSVNEILANWDTVTKSDILSLKDHFAFQNELGCPISADDSDTPCQREDMVDGF